MLSNKNLNEEAKEKEETTNWSANLTKLIATGFGLGFLPICQGTFASLAAIAVYALIIKCSLSSRVGIILFLFFLGVWASWKVEAIWARKDPHEIVIDEIVGYLITMGLFPYSTIKVITGFLIFRAFDILKPFPIKKLERIQGGWGIMLDDAIAGFYGLVIMMILFGVKF
jgi:phosphatidylglycerophosphatase A